MLKGKIAIVTGAAAGMGVAHVRALAEAGAAVVAVDIDPDKTAAGVVFLPSEASSSSTGHDLVADGGYLACGRPAETSVTATARRRSAGQLKTYV
jgi:NAD(P)-dependent dehydrogenase (short-subunit alcohol dehydrogenase family)